MHTVAKRGDKGRKRTVPRGAAMPHGGNNGQCDTSWRHENLKGKPVKHLQTPKPDLQL